MFSNHKSTNRTLALAVFLISLALYVSTMAPTASFWDCGEFIAVAHGLEVNHPPGAPFFELLGRIFSMFMPAGYIAVSINFISSLASALTITLLYLIIVRLVREWKGHPDEMEPVDKIGMYGGAIIGALAFSVTDSFWFNAVEAEVYALSMFFTAIVVWLALKWSEHHDQPNNERWLLLISYMFGLAIGVHLLNLLAIFFVALIVYFKNREFDLVSFCIAGALAVISFLAIYPFTIQILPGIMDNIEKASYGLIGPIIFSIVVILALSTGIYYSHKHNKRIANIFLLSYAMILIGYSSYALIFIRSMADPPIDENDPETADAFISYLKREQYGETPLLTGYTYDNSIGNINRNREAFFPRRYSPQGQHVQQYARYSSDWDFFVNYQVNHMYIRYFNWNFIGKDSDLQDSPWQAGFRDSEHKDNPAHNSYFYLPFLLGLFGLLFHFQQDWKRALSVFVLFFMTGFAIIIFLNQTPMQPRERDYAFVGSFFAFSIWIGMGAVGIIELVKEYLKSNTLVAYGLAGLMFIGVPGLMGYQNYNDHDRSTRYVASDYAYNLLQSLAPNAIIFTNGDNDTFPLWYAQEVESVRTDVRVVCLSLLNTDWYIKQLRDEWSHESAPLPISLTDQEIDAMTQSLSLHQPDTVSVPVNKKLLQSAFSGDHSYKETIGVKPDTSIELYREGVDFGIPVDSLDNAVKWYYRGRSAGTDADGNNRYYTQVQDDAILDILKTNKWLRPVYFANTVSTTSQLNLQKYFRFEGKAFRVVPQKHPEASFGWINPEIHASRLRKFRFRKWNSPDTYLDENIRRMLGNYRFSVTELADRYRKQGMADSASYWLQWGEERIPFKSYDDSDLNSLVLYAYGYAKAQDVDNAVRLSKNAVDQIFSNLSYGINRYDHIQDEITQLNQQAKQARMDADMDEQKQIKSNIQDIISRRDNITQNLYSSLTHLIVIQHIYYSADMDEQADTLTQKVNKITSSRLSLPASKEENAKEFKKFKLN